MGWILLSCSPATFLSANFSDVSREGWWGGQMNSPGEWRGACEVATPITACVPRCFAGHVNSDDRALSIEKFWAFDGNHDISVFLNVFMIPCQDTIMMIGSCDGCHLWDGDPQCILACLGYSRSTEQLDVWKFLSSIIIIISFRIQCTIWLLIIS